MKLIDVPGAFASDQCLPYLQVGHKYSGWIGPDFPISRVRMSFSPVPALLIQAD